jgi:hypothetical protein
MPNTNPPHPPGTNRNLKLFMASPGDVELERQKALGILETLQLSYDLEIYRWEDTLPGYGDPIQQQISDQIPVSECDIVVVILWRRLGTPTGMKRADGTPYLSGTQYELEQAIEAYARNRNGLPRIMIYRKTDEPSPAGGFDPEAIIQYGRLLEYLKLFEPGGKYPAWIYPFRGGEFEGIFRKHIAKVLRELHDAAANTQASTQASTQANPQTNSQASAASRNTTTAANSPAANTSMMLTPEQIEAGKSSLMAAFSREELKQVVFFAWGVDYEAVVTPGPLDAEVFQLLTAANRRQQVGELIRYARRANAGNPTLRSFAAQLGLA